MKIKIKFHNPYKTTWLGRVYLLIGTIGSFSVASYGAKQEDQLAKLLWILLWFFTLMIGYTGWTNECEKYEKNKKSK